VTLRDVFHERRERAPSDGALAPVSGVHRDTSGSARFAQVELEHFDEYVLVAKVGHGGMAEVFLSLSQGPSGFRKLLVIKRMHAHMCSDAECVGMFVNEAKLAARFHHPNVVQTNKIGQAQGRPFLAMEYLEGQPLQRIIRKLKARGEPFPPALAVRIACDALAGLHYVHLAADYDGTPLGIVHRDISPQNVFVTYGGEVKLLDFGIARSVHGDLTRTGVLKGKLGYVAPEQARGDVVEPAADVWGMGVTLWECLSGQRLFHARSDVDMLRAVLVDDIPPLCEVAPHIPEELGEIVHHALKRDPALRYRSAQALQSALEGWLVRSGSVVTREQLAQHQAELFVEEIAERRLIVQQCFARVDLANLEGEPFSDLETDHDAGPAASLRPRTSRTAWAKWLALALVVLIAGVLALRSGERTVQGPQATVVSPLARVSVAAAAPSADSNVREPEAPPKKRIAPAPELRPDDGHDVSAVHEASAIKPVSAAQARPARERALHAPKHSESSLPTQSEAAPAVAEAAAPVAAPGRLALDCTPFAIVSLNKERLGITPIDVELPAGTHTLTLRNPEKGIETTYTVTVPAGEHVHRHIALE
jgi:serine/threonine protein kinase